MPRVLRTEAPFTYASLCSGIEAATVAWHPLGWQPAFFSEIDPFASAVLAHHWPEVPNLGDMTKHKDWPHAKIHLLVAGTPCQAFSVAGLRKGLLDARGNLTLTFLDVADQYDPDWIVWENVPGVLSSKDNAFGCFLGGLAGEDDALVPPGGKWANAGVVLGPQRTVAWRILDAQYFGVAQRRRRVFVVASPRHREGPCAVLFERQGVRRDSPPSREKGEGVTGTLAARTRGGGGLGTDMDCAGGVVGVQASQSGVRLNETIGTLDANYGSRRHNGVMVPTFWNGEQVPQTLDAVLAKGQTMPEKNRFPAVLVPATTHTLKAEGFDASEDGTGRGVPLVPCHTTGAGFWQEGFGTLRAREQDSHENLVAAMQVRRLLPVESERLQGFPDNHTLIPWRKKPAEECPDGPRYKAIGNSMAVPVMNWIGSRIKRFMEGTL